MLSVIGAGLGRTGTMSLKLALEQLGLGPCYHMAEVFKNPAAPGLWVDAADGKPDWEAIFQGYRSTVDWPSSSFYKILADLYPTARIILTERDPEAWFNSTQATIFARDFTAPPSNPFEAMVVKVIAGMFEGGTMHDRDHVISVYLKHNEEVRRLIPADRLLVYYAADGWAPLCAFLGVAVPDTPMPKVNSTKEFQTMVAAARSGAPPAAQ